MLKKPRKIPIKPSSKPVKGPRGPKTPGLTPKVSYVYRKDAFNKVKLA